MLLGVNEKSWNKYIKCLNFSKPLRNPKYPSKYKKNASVFFPYGMSCVQINALDGNLALIKLDIPRKTSFFSELLKVFRSQVFLGM